MLNLRVIEANDLPAIAGDKSDSYCIIQLIPQQEIKEKTEVIMNSLEPKWNQEFHIPVLNVPTSSLFLSLYDKDQIKENLISTLILPLGTMPFATVIDQWYQMIPNEQAQKGGMIHLSIQILPQNFQPYVQQGVPMTGQINPPLQGQYVQSTQQPYIQQQYQQQPYQQQPLQQPYIQQQPPIQGQYVQSQPYVQPQYGQQQYYAGQPTQYYQQPIYGQPGTTPAQPYTSYEDSYNTPPPPRPPGMNDENYKKLHKAQKKMLKKLMKGDVKGCFKKGMKYILKS